MRNDVMFDVKNGLNRLFGGSSDTFSAMDRFHFYNSFHSLSCRPISSPSLARFFTFFGFSLFKLSCISWAQIVLGIDYYPEK